MKLTDQEKMQRRLARDFADALRNYDYHRLGNMLEELDGALSWEYIVPAVAARVTSTHPNVKKWFLQVWLDDANHIRTMCLNDLILIKALRVLLPSYEGPDRLLYRGESAKNRKDRTYGMSWTEDKSVAEDFARATYRLNGGVVLKTISSSDAIICAPALIDDRFIEKEIIVDRRRLGLVEVVCRYSALSEEEYELQTSTEAREYEMEEKKRREQFFANYRKPAETP